jgi:transcriptional regulator with XRE-family HTH domain
MSKAEKTSTFGGKILQLRKERGWSQPEVGKLIGTSGAIVGRYERGEITPSIEVARKLADAFGVTVDSLVSERELPEILKDKEMLERWKALAEVPGPRPRPHPVRHRRPHPRCQSPAGLPGQRLKAPARSD